MSHRLLEGGEHGGAVGHIGRDREFESPSSGAGVREIATTRSPAASAASAKARPSPRLAPVISHTRDVVVMPLSPYRDETSRIECFQRPCPGTRSDTSRRAILDAAFKLVGEVGYAKLTMEGIAARAGVGKQTIYRWWPSKGAVLFGLPRSVGERGGRAGAARHRRPGSRPQARAPRHRRRVHRPQSTADTRDHRGDRERPGVRRRVRAAPRTPMHALKLARWPPPPSSPRTPTSTSWPTCSGARSVRAGNGTATDPGVRRRVVETVLAGLGGARRAGVRPRWACPSPPHGIAARRSRGPGGPRPGCGRRVGFSRGRGGRRRSRRSTRASGSRVRSRGGAC